MKIELTDVQMEQLKVDGWLDVRHGNDFAVYTEWSGDLSFQYGEIIQPTTGKQKAFVFDSNDLAKILPRRPHDPSYYSNDPLCPSCQTYMIYKFDHCPKCGQKLDWSEKGSR